MNSRKKELVPFLMPVFMLGTVAIITAGLGCPHTEARALQSPEGLLQPLKTQHCLLQDIICIIVISLPPRPSSVPDSTESHLHLRPRLTHPTKGPVSQSSWTILPGTWAKQGTHCGNTWHNSPLLPRKASTTGCSGSCLSCWLLWPFFSPSNLYCLPL